MDKERMAGKLVNKERNAQKGVNPEKNRGELIAFFLNSKSLKYFIIL